MPSTKDWKSNPVVQAILAGEHDADLDFISHACKQRIKRMWRPQMRVKLVDTGNVEIEGQCGVITKINSKTCSVRLDGQEEWQYYNVPTRMLAKETGTLTQVPVPTA